jgi:hypothetical protein
LIAMTEADIFEQTKTAYLCLIHPVVEGDAYRQDVAPVLALAPCVPEPLVASMLVGASWRERLLGLCLAMANRPATFVEPMLQSLREPRGIAIVPACAVLGVLARHGLYELHPALAYAFDREVFDGEIGWAVDKALHYAGLPAAPVDGNGPNSGQKFQDHAAVYDWIYRQPRRVES